MSPSPSATRGLRGQFKTTKAPVHASPEKAPLNLTLGVEIECILLRDTRPQLAQEMCTSSLSARKTIHNALSQPMQARCSSCGELHSFNLPLNPIADDDDADLDTTYTRWTVDADGSLRLTEPELKVLGEKSQYVHVGQVEITSRIIHSQKPLLTTKSIKDPHHTHEISWETEINAVYTRLNEAFNTPSGVQNHRLIVNPTCGLHVHIGNESKGFPLTTVKNLLSMYVTNEAAIDSLQSVDRVTGSTLAFSAKDTRELESTYPDEFLPGQTFNKPWSAHFQWAAFRHTMAGNSRKKVETQDLYPERSFWKYPSLRKAVMKTDIPSWLRLITRANQITDLGDLQGTMFHRSTVNLQNLGDFSHDGSKRGTYNNKKMTVEFRQGAATLRSAELIAWINVLLTIFRFCHSKTLREIEAVCDGIWNNPDHTAIDLLKLIDAPAATQNHYRDILGLDSDESSSYAETFRSQELEAAARFGSDDFFLPLMQQNIEARSKALSHLNLGKRIEEKLVNGCYGQYDAGYVSKLHVSPEKKQQLTIGWAADRSKEIVGPDDESAWDFFCPLGT